MLINNKVYQKYIELADRISDWITANKIHHTIRSASFFPLVSPIYKTEPTTAWVDGLGPTRTEGEILEPETKGFSPDAHAHQSPFCCGLKEVRSGLVGGGIMGYYQVNPIMNNAALAKHLGYPSPNNVFQEEIDLAATAWRLRMAGGSGLLIYTAPITEKGGLSHGYDGYITKFEKFGFVKIAEFANGQHSGHRVGLWACHAPNISHTVGRLSWDVSGIMNAARIAAQETTSESGKTEVSSVLDADGGKALPKKVASKKLAAQKPT